MKLTLVSFNGRSCFMWLPGPVVSPTTLKTLFYINQGECISPRGGPLLVNNNDS